MCRDRRTTTTSTDTPPNTTPTSSTDPDKAWNELSGSWDEVWDLTDRTFGKLTNLAYVYSDQVKDKIEQNWLNGWPGNNENDPSNGPKWRASWSSSSDNNPSNDNESDHQSHHAHHRFHKGRRGRDHKLWAYPVPSARQYDRCIENNGTSAWSRDGVWRCLFPDSNPEAFNNKSSNLEDKQWFTDYSVYLDWRRAIRKAEEVKREQEWQRIKEKNEKIWVKPVDSLSKSNPSNQSNSQPNSSSSSPKYINEIDADKEGKNVISTSIISKTVTRDDGSLETKRTVKKWYDDNSVSITETVNTATESGLNSGSVPNSGSNNSGPKGGWFWK